MLRARLEGRDDVFCRPVLFSPEGAPERYEVEFRIRSICSVEDVESLLKPGVENRPVFAERFRMVIDLPEEYPCVDAPADFRFLVRDAVGAPVPHPWHPNIRWFGPMAGHVCLNRYDSFSSLVWGVERVEDYLRYRRYHALNEPPYPEDQQVAAWVIRRGEPNEWIYFDL